ncbi:MAG: hypothetical protein H6733_16475 [Alphaproteobacteria bacterium]|nr:hypothetical protein [Alphaproteobacteria bacterium]
MRSLVASLLFLAACRGATDDTAPLDTAVVDSGPELSCASWDEFTCVPGGSANCFAQCLPVYKITCDSTECFVQGRGLGSGQTCAVTLPSTDACGWCQNAFDQCLGL